MNAGMKDTTNVMSKFLALGMPLKDVVIRSTWNPAKEIKLEQLGNLSVGAPADVAVLRLEKGKFGFLDQRGGRLDGTERLGCELTLRDGEVVWDLNGLASLPGKDAAADPRRQEEGRSGRGGPWRPTGNDDALDGSCSPPRWHRPTGRSSAAPARPGSRTIRGCRIAGAKRKTSTGRSISRARLELADRLGRPYLRHVRDSDPRTGEAEIGIYLDGRRTKPLPGEHRWMVYCIDFKTGKIRWEREVHAVRRTARTI